MEPTMSCGEVEGSGGIALGGVVRIDDGRIQAHLDEVDRSTVEETLNAFENAGAKIVHSALRERRVAAV
jgi:hypothetical protein